MSNFDEKTIERIKRLEREVERLRVKERAIGWTYLAAPLTAADWTNASKGVADRAIVDLSAVFGVPAGVKAVLMSIQTTDDTAAQYIRFGPDSTNNFALTCRTQVANQAANAYGVVPCDANGDVYCHPSNDYILSVNVWIWGYFL